MAIGAGPFYWDKTADKFPMQDGKPVLIAQEEFEDCCCGQDCPTDCTDMGNTRTVTFSGFTGTYAAMNGVAITLDRLLCLWYSGGEFENDCLEGYDILLSCIGTEWVLQLELSSWGVPGSGTCDDACDDDYESTGRGGNEPPLGNYSMQRVAGGSGCSAATVTATLEKP